MNIEELMKHMEDFVLRSECDVEYKKEVLEFYDTLHHSTPLVDNYKKKEMYVVDPSEVLVSDEDGNILDEDVIPFGIEIEEDCEIGWKALSMIYPKVAESLILFIDTDCPVWIIKDADDGKVFFIQDRP